MENKAYINIIDTLKRISSTKQVVYRNGIDCFNQLREALNEYAKKLHKDFRKIDESVEIKFREINAFECELKVGSDVVIFSMHTNVFNFPKEHGVSKMKYVKENKFNAYCSLIQVHNFLSDTVKYNRLNDVGYLIGRVFINKDRHFFVEGRSQLGFLYNDFPKMIFSKQYIDALIESAINYVVNFDLVIQPFQEVSDISYHEKQINTMNAGMVTGKRLGFKSFDE